MHKKCDENVKVLGKTYDQKQWILRKPGQKQQRSTQKERKSQGGHQMKKKVISALLASTMIVSLVACGSTGSGWFCSGIQRTPDDELLPRHPGRPRGGSPCRRRRPVAYPVADCSSVFQTGYRNHRPVYIRWLLERVFPGPGKETNYPLQTYIRQISVQIPVGVTLTAEQYQQLAQNSNKSLEAAKVFIALVPMLIVYPFLQKYFVTGITLGAVKE